MNEINVLTYPIEKAFPVGPGELILILVIVLIVFGAGKLPQIGDALGKGIRNFKKSVTGTTDEIDITPPKKEVESKKEEPKVIPVKPEEGSNDKA